MSTMGLAICLWLADDEVCRVVHDLGMVAPDDLAGDAEAGSFVDGVPIDKAIPVDNPIFF